MKRFLTLLFATLLLSAALCMSASASDFDAAAEDLSAIGMFRGTANGFELDRVPTRSEAAIMLVRLYGAEEDAKAAYASGEISHPFTDVSTFTSPYVAWLYTNGIANGTTATTFGSANPCSAKMYCAFLLRALGYQDGTDFQYADTLAFAQSKGFYEPLMFSGDFLRDDLAALTYQGLAADLKDGSTYLLDSLVKSGAIDAGAAKPMTEKIEAYRGMEGAMAAMDETAVDLDIDMDMDMTMTADGETTKTPSTSTGNMKILVDGSDVQLAYVMKTSVEGVSMDTSMWMKDGWMYLSMGDGEDTMNIKYPVADQLAALEGLGVVEVDAMDVSGLAMIDSLTAEKSGSDTVYTMVLSKNLGGLMGGVSELIGQEADTGMDIGEIKAVLTVDRGGTLKKMAMTFSASMTMSLPMEDGTTVPMSMDYDYDMTMTVNATGKSVKISFPDFSSFEEIDPAQLAA